MSDLEAYLGAVWGKCRPDSYMEVSVRVNGAEGAVGKVRWRTQHVVLGDFLSGDGVEDLIGLSKKLDRIDVYLGCMPLSELPEMRGSGTRGRGKGALRESVPGVWFDIDAVAPGREVSAKGVPLFATPEVALEALDEFCDERGVRAGVVTNSGWGLHAWILADKAMDADAVEIVRRWNVEFAEWARERYGVHVDVVSDRTRVLRAPETVNWRRADNLDTAVGVQLLRLENEIRFSEETLGLDEHFRRQMEERRKRAREGADRGWVGADAGDCALFDGRCALDVCDWGEILGGYGWTRMEPEGDNEIERWGRPRADGGEGVSSAVVFADAPWVLVVFSEAAGLPSWEEIRRSDGEVRPNTKWRTWVRLAYEGDEMKASADAVTVALHGYPRHWPKNAVDVLLEHGRIFRGVAETLGVGAGVGEGAE